jgi:nucleoside-diphosphate-sugar epimerase
MKKPAQRSLVTGVAGFIGSHLVDRLIGLGNDVVVLDNLSDGTLSNLRQSIDSPKLDFIKGDVLDDSSVERAVDRVDTIFHEAAIASVSRGLEDPKLLEQVNVEGTRNLLKWAAKAHVKRLVFASSAAVYGFAERLPVSEKQDVKPVSLYGQTKLAAEELCLKSQGNSGVSTIVLRYFNVYGPRMSLRSDGGVVGKFVESILAGEKPVIYGDGNQTRDFVNVKDVVELNLRAMSYDGSDRVFNVGSGKSVTINALLGLVFSLTTGLPVSPNHLTSRKQEIAESLADISLAARLLGYSPEFDLITGLRSYLKEIRAPVG